MLTGSSILFVAGPGVQLSWPWRYGAGFRALLQLSGKTTLNFAAVDAATLQLGKVVGSLPGRQSGFP